MKKLTALESLRGFASVYVAIGHWVLSIKRAPIIILLLFKFGQEAVIIFFVLSGFVIAYSYNKTLDKSIKKFLIKRFRRIYFPFLCAVLISLIKFNFHFDYRELIGNILMLQDFKAAKPGNIVQPFLGNVPLWSLSYEWIFYLIFPFVYPLIGRSKHRVHYIGLFSLINIAIYCVHPNHIFMVLGYLIIWWTGLEIYEKIFNGNKSYNKLFLYYFLIIAMLCLFQFHSGSWRNIELGIFPFLTIRHYFFALLILTICTYLPRIVSLSAIILRPFAYISPVSYAIYVIHYPILVQSTFNSNLVVNVTAKVTCLLVAAYLIEIVLQPKVNKVLK